MSIFFICFIIRSIALFYRLWTGCYLPYWLYWTMCYTIPFIVPFSMQLYFFIKDEKVNRRKTQLLIEDSFMKEFSEDDEDDDI